VPALLGIDKKDIEIAPLHLLANILDALLELG
jgi:hypothetical protein